MNSKERIKSDTILIQKTLIGMNGDSTIHAVEMSANGAIVVIDNDYNNKMLIYSVMNHCPYAEWDDNALNDIEIQYNQYINTEIN